MFVWNVQDLVRFYTFGVKNFNQFCKFWAPNLVVTVGLKTFKLLKTQSNVWNQSFKFRL